MILESKVGISDDSFVYVTNDGEACSKRWVAALVQMNCEKKVAVKFITYPGSKELATPIPDEQIERLRFLLNNADAKVSIVENLRAGDRVRLVRGPMKGLEGELSHVEEGKPMVAIRIDGLGYACVSVDKANLELIS